MVSRNTTGWTHSKTAQGFFTGMTGSASALVFVITVSLLYSLHALFSLLSLLLYPFFFSSTQFHTGAEDAEDKKLIGITI